ncbi:MAG: PD-(D/E)XK nuclease family protein [Thermoanaerobaculia bacterium]|nr:PD-(D/E)XK nuclease family protein [Thermoanaerobaculia bacterium]
MKRLTLCATRSLPISPALASVPLAVARGPRAAERLLLDEIEAVLAEPRDLARPLRVVVPSRSLRRHVAAALVRRRGRAALGFSVQTLFGLALEVLQRSGDDAAEGDAVFGLLVRRFAAATPSLAGPLDGLVEGYGPVVGTVRDLLDAGLEAAHVAAAGEALGEVGPWVSEAERERADELLRLALAAERGLSALGLRRRTDVLRRAAAALGAAADPEVLLPTGALWVHGFADVTGLAGDLLDALVRHAGARLILDRPPDPSDPLADEGTFSARLAERYGGGSTVTSPAEPTTTRQAFAAPGADAEAREVARRIRHLLDAGERAEGIAVVARELSPGTAYSLSLRRHLARFAVPFSGAGTLGPWLPHGRRLQALIAVLRRGPQVPTGRWLEAVAPPPGGDLGRHALISAELRLAFHSLGAGRLAEVAALAPELFAGNASFLLPIIQGFRVRSAEDEKDLDEAAELTPERPVRRSLPTARLVAALGRARGLVTRLAEWPREAPLEDHLARLESLVTQDLDWRTEPARGPLEALLETLRRGVPGAFSISFREFVDLVADELANAGRDELGGGGGGVALLGATEARGLVFDHLFLVGLNRDLFPRPIAEDPLLPDDQRRALARVLPDLAGKTAGHGEERHLFASLLAAAPAVTLSWQATSDDGQPIPPSPLIERLLATDGGLEVETLPPWMTAEPWADLPAEDRAIVAGLERDAVALHAELGGDAVASTRLAVLAEFDAGVRVGEAPGPFLGRVGPALAGDRRTEDPSVTAFESLVACPWRTFLERVLKVVPTPDPLLAAPALTPLLVGNLVHEVLAAIVQRTAPPVTSFEDALVAAPCAPEWPAAEEFEELLRSAAKQVLSEQAAALPGLARALAEAGRPYLAAARQAGALGSAVLAAEVEGLLPVVDGAGRERHLRFRADLVERQPERIATPFRPELEPVRLTDFKTGKPTSSAAKAAGRETALQKDVAAGKRLQAVAYSLAAGRGGIGRYLYLKPEIADDQREVVARGDAPHFAEPFARVVATAFDAWDEGAFVPRLTEPEKDQEPRRCSYCPVHEACLRGDTGARRRLVRWAAAAQQGALGEDAASRALADIWFLPARKP